MIYAGIGSRKTPEEILEKMKKISLFLSSKGAILRSGGAKGADTAFESGADKKEIYTFGDASEEAKQIARKFHPSFDNISPYSQGLIARNSHIILGADLKSKVDFVVCWTQGGKDEGGTGHSIKIARDSGIPIFNLAVDGDIERLKIFIGRMEEERKRLQTKGFSPETDGVDHINVYSKGKTELGRFLSNFSKCSIETPYGKFSSIEGYWFFLRTDHKDKLILRKMYGHEAKSVGSKMSKERPVETALPEEIYEKMFKELISSAIFQKINKNKEMAKKLVDNNLPLVHYYEYGGKAVVPNEHHWVILSIEKIRNRLIGSLMNTARDGK